METQHAKRRLTGSSVYDSAQARCELLEARRDDLNALDGDLLGGADGMVMTDDTVDDPPRATFQAPMQFPPPP